MAMPTDKPTIIARRELARSRLFCIEELDLRFSNGERRTFERLRSSGGFSAVMIVAMPDPEHVLLVREYAAGFERHLLGLPKGSIDPGEDMISAANRELKEECGFGARSIEPLTELSIAPNYMAHRITVVLATGLYPERLPGDEPEPLEVVRFRLDQLDQLLNRDDFHEARSIAALYMARDYLDNLSGYDITGSHADDTPLPW
ncbi:ADP compounds hydrolase NudE [Halotalea alkalilenta]|uniref:ADP compounds hydrolase NudE n=1 Tax=Halotalea alkalilenta TaxID=376489 RepID=UPI0012373F48